MGKLALVIKNPIVIVMPIVAILLFLWQQYAFALPDLSHPYTNIMPNGNLDELDARGFPIGWQLSRASASVTAKTVEGHDSLKSIELINTTETANGNTTLTSPIAITQSGETYFYKAYYKSNVPFDLLMRTNNNDGGYEQVIVQRYDPNTEWETVSHAFTATEKMQSVQFIYSVSGKGELRIDNTYLESNPPDVQLNPAHAVGTNIMPNASLETNDGVNPDGWSKYSQGDNQATLEYRMANGEPYLHSAMAGYKNGEAKWQTDPMDVKPGQGFQFGVTYKSDTPANVVAEYVMTSGERQFEVVGNLLPAQSWTKFNGTFEIPSGAVNATATVVQQANGAVDTKNYELYDITKPGEVAWDKPRLSFTFDDGWESAYATGVSMLDKAGYKSTHYLNPSTLDTPNFMSSSQVAHLVQSGHEIASHGYEHIDFTTLDRKDINYQLEHADKYFTQVHSMKKVNFSVPFGGNDAQTEFYARKYYDSLRGTGGGVNTKQNFDRYDLQVLYVGNSVTLEKIKAALADAKAKNGWLILVYHRIESSGVGETIINPAKFQQQLDAVKASGIEVTTVANALKEIDSQ